VHRSPWSAAESGRLRRCAALRLDHDLAGRLVRFHVAVRVGDLVEGEHPVHVGMVGAVLDSADDVRERRVASAVLAGLRVVAIVVRFQSRASDRAARPTAPKLITAARTRRPYAPVMPSS
jgi:hypothetical protein